MNSEWYKAAEDLKDMLGSAPHHEKACDCNVCGVARALHGIPGMTKANKKYLIRTLESIKVVVLK